MFDWAKNAVGLTDKHHGAQAIQSVKHQTAQIPYTELKKEDLRWELVDTTNVETKTFYMTTDDGLLALVQVIYSNVFNVRTMLQFGAKIFSSDPKKPHLWNSDIIANYEFVNNRYDFTAPKCSMTISEDGKSYHVKSNVNPECIVDLKFQQLAPGFMVGKDGTTTFGTNPSKPWGKMRHMFWPRCHVEGTMKTKDGAHDMKGKAIFIHALQGMKPHFAAARWNFCNFQGPKYTAVSMEYITPSSYDSTVVSVGCVATDGKLIIANANSSATHTRAEQDAVSGCAEPKDVTYAWSGKSQDGKEVTAEIKGSIGDHMDRVDIMDEIPKFLKGIVAGATGAKPFIYQYGPKKTLSLNIGGETTQDDGRVFAEATFIS